jgi:pilus assembly protein CpaF
MFVVSVRERGKEEHKFTFRKPEIVIGRLRSNDIILPKRNISKRHARLELTKDGTIMLLDNGSTNGCYINGKKVAEPTPVSMDDKIFMGDYILQAQVLEEKSAIEEFTGESAMVGSSRSGQDRPTVADIDSSILDDELKRMQEELSNQGPSTVVINPDDVPTEMPDNLFDETGLEMAVVEDDQGETMRFKEAAESTGGEVQFEIEDDELLEAEVELAEAPVAEDLLPAELPDEDLLDISLEEEEPEEATVEPSAPFIEEPAPVVEPARVAAKEPARPVPAAAFAPSSTHLDGGLSAALEDHYDAISGAFDQWLEEGGELAQAHEFVGSLLIDTLGDLVGDNLDELAGQITAELGYIGAVAALLEQPQIGEVFVAPSGHIQAYDWAGARVETQASLSCPSACARIAERILDAAGEPGEGFSQARLQDNTLARVFQIPFAADIPALRFVRPFQTTMSLGKLTEAGILTAPQAQCLKSAVAKGRNLLLTGPTTATLGLLVHSLVGVTEPTERLLVAGDRFVGGPGLENATIFDPHAVHSHDFSLACSQMGFDRIAMESGSGDTVAATIELGALLQVPFIVSARLTAPTNVAALLGLANADTRLAFLESLDAAGVVLVTVGEGKVDSISLFTLEDGEPKLVDMSA